MNKIMPNRLPATSALIAFETAARLGSLSLAAKELETSQPAISRTVTQLEKQLSARLFERSRNGVSLTDAGQRFHNAVVAALAIIRSATNEVAVLPAGEQVVIACSHEISHFLLLPRYDALSEALGEKVRIRILTYHYEMKNLPTEPAADVVLAWESSFEAEDRLETIHDEAVIPICSPAYARTHAKILYGPVQGWGGLTFLDHSRPNEGWATWEDWFRVTGHPEQTPRYMSFDNYSYLLEAAATGHGIMLGWRHFIEQRIDSGALIKLTDSFIEFNNRFCGALTEKGLRNPAAYKCLEFLSHNTVNQSTQTIPNPQV